MQFFFTLLSIFNNENNKTNDDENEKEKGNNYYNFRLPLRFASGCAHYPTLGVFLPIRLAGSFAYGRNSCKFFYIF